MKVKEYLWKEKEYEDCYDFPIPELYLEELEAYQNYEAMVEYNEQQRELSLPPEGR